MIGRTEGPSHRTVRPVRRLRGEVYVPGDKSISHRAVLQNAIAEGESQVQNLGLGDDVRSSIASMRALGVEIEETGPNACTIRGAGSGGLREPGDILDVGNSGTTTRLLSGIMAAQPFLTVLTGDDSLRSRPMDRIIDPLRRMGAEAMGRQGDDYLPVAIRGGNLKGIEYPLPVASAQVKSCLLLAGAFASGETHLIEPAASRDHTERLLAAQGADIEVDGLDIVVRGGRPLRAVDVTVPGDTSSAAFWVVAACIHPDAEVAVRNVGISDGRTGIFDVLAMMGGEVEITNRRVVGGEPVGDIVARSSRLKGTAVGGDFIPRLIDEAPILAVAACFADGDTVVTDATELRYKESDRIAVVARELSRLGGRIEEREDGMVIHGSGRLAGGEADSYKDHRMAMALAIAALVADGPVNVLRPQSVTVSYPSFWDDLSALSGE